LHFLLSIFFMPSKKYLQNQYACPSMYKDMYYRANRWSPDTGLLIRWQLGWECCEKQLLLLLLLLCVVNNVTAITTIMTTTGYKNINNWGWQRSILHFAFFMSHSIFIFMFTTRTQDSFGLQLQYSYSSSSGNTAICIIYFIIINNTTTGQI